MNVTPDDLIAIIGHKEVAIYVLQKQLAEARAKLEALEKKDTTA